MSRWKNQVKSAVCRFPDCTETKIYCQHYCRRDYERLWRGGIPFDTYPIRQVVGRELGEAPYQSQRWTSDELMAEWDFMRGFADFETFGARVGIKQESWVQAFRRAQAAGDPRARRAASDPTTWSDPESWARKLRDPNQLERNRRYKAKRKQGATA